MRFMILPQFNEAKRILRCDHRSTPASVIPTSYTWFKGANGDEVTTSVCQQRKTCSFVGELGTFVIQFCDAHGRSSSHACVHTTSIRLVIAAETGIVDI